MSEEKTEQPTATRRKKARKDGQVPRTQELGAWSAMLATSLVLPAAVGWEVDALQSLTHRCLRTLEDPSVPAALDLLAEAGAHMVVAVGALSCVVLLVSVALTLAQGGFFVSTKSITPTLAKLSLIKGAKRVFGPHALWEGAKMLVKCALVGVLAYGALTTMMPMLGGLVPFETVFTTVADEAMALIRGVALTGVVAAALDYAVQRRRTMKEVRMTKHEVKQEHKQTEGDPLVKGARRSRQLAASRNRMIAEVPTADVVLVNPTHVAVALRYQPERHAPIVVARGAGAIAIRIRERAGEADVPLVRDVPLARALYSSTEVGQEIPAELFAAVAQVLAFVIARRNSGRVGGRHDSPRRVELPEVRSAAQRRRRTPGTPPVTATTPAAIASGPVSLRR